MDDFRFDILFNSISVILGLCVGSNERPCAVEPHLRWKISPPPLGLKPRTPRSAGQRLTCLATRAHVNGNLPQWLNPSLKHQTKIAADNMLSFYFYLSKKIRLDFLCESSV